MSKRKAIRDYVHGQLDGLTGLAGLPVFKARQATVSETTKAFICIYFVDGEIRRINFDGDRETDGELVIRINSRVIDDVDDALDLLAAPISLMMEDYPNLGGLVSKCEPSRFEYGDQDGSPFSHLELTYQITYEQKQGEAP